MKITRRPAIERACCHGVRKRTAACLLGVAVGACLAVPLRAAVIDDFEDGVRFVAGSGGMDYFLFGLTNGQMVIKQPNPVATPTDNFLLTYDNVYWPGSYFPYGNLEGRRTLELRMDLIHASTNDLFLLLGCGGPTAGADTAYLLLVDRNEVALTKYSDTAGGTIFYWDTRPITNENVTVGLAFTKTNSSLLITVRIVEKGNPRATLYERTFVDGPGQDGPMPPPNPFGFSGLIPDVGRPYTNFTYAAVGCWQLISSIPPPLELRLDNLEYDVYLPPHLEIVPTTNGATLTWPKPFKDHIIVEADSLQGPWCPCPQPYSLIGDACCQEITCGSSQKFFKLVPGIQFTDDFGGTNPPWTPYFYLSYDSNRFQFAVTNGTYRITATGNSSDGRVPILPPGPDIVVRDFTASVDLLEGSSTGIGIGARCWRDPNGFPGNGNGYIGSVSLNQAGHVGQGRLNVWNGSNLYSSAYFNIDPAADYRLQFSGVGRTLSVKLFNLTDPNAPLRQFNLTDSAFSQGLVAFWIESPGPNTIVLDNFFVTATTP